MILALQEEPSFQTKRRILCVQDHENPYMPNSREEYESTMHALTLNEHKDNQDAANWIVTGIRPSPHGMPESRVSLSDSAPPPILAPDTRHVLGATPSQITQLYADTNPGSRLRRLDRRYDRLVFDALPSILRAEWRIWGVAGWGGGGCWGGIPRADGVCKGSVGAVCEGGEREGE
ncbi:hypothetical protein DID88_000214 [Monilinia fructigena]|uniref:Uncharacterized protein n=1 Tax=Monilinia fructigena TaxID=38457 RepID=A0A395IQ17_9HELO|nr:hypothetical protein DID88_000214 [Monilinia fructigena]